MALQGLDIVSTLFNLTKRLTSSLRFESVDIHHLVALDLLNIWEMTAGASVRGANQMSQMGAPEAICDLVTSHEPNILVITASLMAHLAIIIGSNAPKNRFLVISNFVYVFAFMPFNENFVWTIYANNRPYLLFSITLFS